MIPLTCPHCGKGLKVKDELAGKRIKCPKCGKPAPVPTTVLTPRPGSVASRSGTDEAKTLAADKPRPDPVDARTLAPGDAPTTPPPAQDALRTRLGESDENDEAISHDEFTRLLSAPQAADEIGRLGTYRILKILGAGGMGVVFQAEDPQLKRAVAIKAMLPALAANTQARKRFLREAQAAAGIKHNHIVTIFQVGEERGMPFLAMEFLDGEPLDVRLKRQSRLPVPEVLRIGREVCEGLAAAHERGLIHRDIKPANIWLEGKKGQVKILDFGLARATTDQTHLTQTGAIIGTPAYMAPEQAGGSPVDQRCDLFSVGCVLYRLCTGELPFKGNDTLSIISALALETPPEPATINAQIPAELSDLVMELLAKKPADRPESAQVVAERLQTIVDEMTVVRQGGSSTRQKSRVGKTGVARPLAAGKWGVILVLGIAACVLLAGGWLGFQFLYKRAQDGASTSTGSQPEKVWEHALDQLDAAAIPAEERMPDQPAGVVVVLGSRQMRHEGAYVTSLVFSPDSKVVASSAQYDSSVRLWDVSTLREKAVLPNCWTVLGFTPDGKTLVTTSPEGVRIWDLSGAEPRQHSVLQIEGIGLPGTVAISANGKVLAVLAADKTLRLWDMMADPPRERPAIKGLADDSWSLAISSDGTQIAVTDRKQTVRRWDLSAEEPKEETALKTPTIVSLAFSPDGKLLACGGDWKTGLVLWDVSVKEPVEKFPHFVEEGNDHFGAWSLAFAPGGKALAVSSPDGMSSLLDLTGNKLRKTFPIVSDGPVAISPDGKTLATKTWSNVRIWDLGGKAPVERTEYQPTVTRIAFAPDSKRLYCRSFDNGIQPWALDGGVFRKNSFVRSPANPGEDWVSCNMAVSSDGKLLASQLRDVTFVYDLTGTEPTVLAELKTAGAADCPVVFSPIGSTLACGFADGTVQTWDLSGAEPKEGLKFQAQTKGVTSLFFSSDSTFACYSHEANSVQFWDVSGNAPQKGAVVAVAAPVQMEQAALSADGHTLATRVLHALGGDDQVWLWDISPGQEPKRKGALKSDKAQELWPWSLAPDGKTLITTQRMNSDNIEKTLDLWDAGTGKKLREWTFPGYVNNGAFAFAPDSRHLAVANLDSTVYILRLDEPKSSAGR